jgi:hypothetical protein
MAAPASAFTFRPGYNEASVKDFNSTFVIPSGEDRGDETEVYPTTSPPAVGDEIRSIVWIDALKQGGDVYNDGKDPELTGLVYDLECVKIAAVPGVSNTYYFGSAGAFSDTFTGRLDLYEDSDNDKNGFPDSSPSTASNPSWWDAVPYGSDPSTNRDSFPTYSDGSLLLSATFLPIAGLEGDAGEAVYLVLTFFPNGNGVTSYYAHLDIPDGYNFSGSKIVPTLWGDGVTSDIRFFANYNPNDINVPPGGDNLWPIRSQDPVEFNVEGIPEPATLSLIGFGMAGLAFIRRRRK